MVSPDFWTRFWVVRHWQGKLSLGDAFWVNGVLLNLALIPLGQGVDRLTAGSEFGWMVVEALVLVILLPVTTVWQMVGIWRSARRFPGWKFPDGLILGRRLWAVAACVVALSWTLPRLMPPAAFIPFLSIK